MKSLGRRITTVINRAKAMCGPDSLNHLNGIMWLKALTGNTGQPALDLNL
jgi:hypothetical protein